MAPFLGSTYNFQGSCWLFSIILKGFVLMRLHLFTNGHWGSKCLMHVILITKRNLLMCLFGQATPDDSFLAVCVSPARPVSASPVPYSQDCPVLSITGLSQQLPACLPLALGAGVPGNGWAFLSPEKPVAESCLQSAVHSRVSLIEFAPDLWDTLSNKPSMSLSQSLALQFPVWASTSAALQGAA